MAIAVSLLGVLIVAVGVIGVIIPRAIIRWVADFPSRPRYWFAVVIRFVLGVFLILAAPFRRIPLVEQIIGVIAIAAAIALLVMGPTRLDTLINWWLGRGPWLMRVSCTVAMAFGALLIYAGA